MLAEARARALGLGDEVAWVEKVVISTQGEVDAETLAEREDAIGDLQRLLQEATGDDALLAQIEDDIGKLVRQLPHEARGASQLFDDIQLPFGVHAVDAFVPRRLG